MSLSTTWDYGAIFEMEEDMPAMNDVLTDVSSFDQFISDCISTDKHLTRAIHIHHDISCSAKIFDTPPVK